jgi:hypothetical protein
MENLEAIMKEFSRQKSGNASTANINIDFGAAATKVAHVLEPGEYGLRVDSARVVQNGQNILVALDLVMMEGGDRIDNRPLWVEGPKAGNSPYAAENQNLIAKLLARAGLPTAGDVGALIPQLAGVEFYARLVLAVDNRSGRTYNSIAEIYVDDAP